MKVNAILIALCAAYALAYPTASKKLGAIAAIDTTGHVGIDLKSGQETSITASCSLRHSINDDNITNEQLDRIGNKLNEQLNAFALALERLKRCAARASSEQQSVIHRMQEHHEDEDEHDEHDNEYGSTEVLLHVINDSIGLLNTARDCAFRNSHAYITKQAVAHRIDDKTCLVDIFLIIDYAVAWMKTYINMAEVFPSPEADDGGDERDHNDVVLKDLFINHHHHRRRRC